MIRHQINKVWVDDTAVYASTVDGLEASYPFSRWPRLTNATKEQRSNFYLTYSGIHWPDIDEDLSFESMFAYCNLCVPTVSEDTVFMVAEPNHCVKAGIMTPIKIIKAEYAGGLSVALLFSDGKQQTVDVGAFIKEHPHPQYNKYAKESFFKEFSLRNGNIIWGANADLLFPIEDLYSNKFE